MTVKKAIALLLVLALLAAGVLYLRKVERADQQNMQDLYTMVEPLQRERDVLVQERDQIAADYALQMRDVGTVELLFREMDNKIFSEVYPLMRDRGITGVLGLSLQEYPGLQNKMTLEQYSRLLMDGWGSCLVYSDGMNDPETWFTTLKNNLEHDKLPMPTAIFFPEGKYDSSMKEMLLNWGIQTVVVPTEDGRSNTVTAPQDGLWFTGAMPWNYTGVNRDTELLAYTNGANLLFTISFNNLWDAYDRDAFVKVLDNWVSMLLEENILQEIMENGTPANQGNTQTESAEEQLAKPLLKVTNLETARATHEEAAVKNAQLEREFESHQAELDGKISSLDEQIRSLYDQWGQIGK